MKNTGEGLEKDVYEKIVSLVNSNLFMLADPYVKVYMKKKYYSRERGDNIEFDVVVEKYLVNPDDKPDAYPALRVIIECKDYKGSIPVDDVEEFFAKLQQIGAANTKGMIITRDANFQKGALKYAEAKGIALARLLPENQLIYALYLMFLKTQPNHKDDNIKEALTERDYTSNQSFFVTSGESTMEAFICNILGDENVSKIWTILDDEV
ncbi:restriction endonuclease [[Clostridium] innocuum]|nr:restriction endonuclease [[Clostridium] innocuum]